MAAERSSPVILRRHTRALIGAGAAIVLLIVLGQFAAIYADYLWFDALGYRGVYTTELGTKVALAVGAFVLTAGWVSGNVALAARLSPGHHFQIRGVKWTLPASTIRRWVTLAGMAFSMIVGLGFAGGAGEPSPTTVPSRHRPWGCGGNAVEPAAPLPYSEPLGRVMHGRTRPAVARASRAAGFPTCAPSVTPRGASGDTPRDRAADAPASPRGAEGDGL